MNGSTIRTFKVLLIHIFFMVGSYKVVMQPLSLYHREGGQWCFYDFGAPQCKRMTSSHWQQIPKFGPYCTNHTYVSFVLLYCSLYTIVWGKTLRPVPKFLYFRYMVNCILYILVVNSKIYFPLFKLYIRIFPMTAL